MPHDIRVAGGHIMISALDGRLKDPSIVMNAVKWMDVLVMPTIIQSVRNYGASTGDGETRRLYYGKAGAFRPKTFPNGAFGIEYRTPGPEWITLIHSVRGRKALATIELNMIRSVENAFEFKAPKVSKDLINLAINHEDTRALTELEEIANYV
jgi:hypothetical protein